MSSAGVVVWFFLHNIHIQHSQLYTVLEFEYRERVTESDRDRESQTERERATHIPLLLGIVLS